MFLPCKNARKIAINRNTSLCSAFKMARPAVPAAQKRSINFTFRITQEELNKLALLAEICGQQPANLIREKLFSGRFPTPKIAKLDTETYLELKKIGVNLNQLTRQVNQGNFPPELLTTLNKLYHQQDIIIQILLHDSQSENW